MEVREKAKELVDKMFNGFQFGIDYYTAKQCALIAVDEIMKVEQAVKMNFWKAVKKEIEKL